MNVEQTVKIFKALLQGHVSRAELAKRVDVCPSTIGKLLVSLKAEKLIHVIDYTKETDGRNRVKVYALGDGEDAQPKDSQPQRVRSRRSYVKKVQITKPVQIKTTFVGGKSPWQ